MFNYHNLPRSVVCCRCPRRCDSLAPTTTTRRRRHESTRSKHRLSSHVLICSSVALSRLNPKITGCFIYPPQNHLYSSNLFLHASRLHSCTGTLVCSRTFSSLRFATAHGHSVWIHIDISSCWSKCTCLQVRRNLPAHRIQKT